MSISQQMGLIFHAATMILILSAALLFVNSLLIHYLDDRGMYAVPPFSWLPWLGGGALCSAALDAVGIAERLNPGQLWLSAFWALRFDELYEIWLRPSDIALAVVAGFLEFYYEMLYDGWRVWVFQGSAILATW